MNNQMLKKSISFLLFIVLLMSVTGTVLAARPSSSVDVDYISVHVDGTLECYVTWENIPKAKGFMLHVMDGVNPEYEWGYSYTMIRGSGKNYSGSAFVESVIPAYAVPHSFNLILEVCDSKGNMIDSYTSSESFTYYPPSE